MNTHPKPTKYIVTSAAACALLSLPACSDSEDGKGTVDITTWGEEYIEDGLPSDAFLDSWSVKYSKFLVVYHAVTIADDHGNVVAELDHPLVFDMVHRAQGTPKTLATFELKAKSWPDLSYQVGHISDDAKPGDLATEEDVERLQNEEASLHVEGTATSPTGEEEAFSWSFAPATLFEHCHGAQDGKEVEGVLVTNGGTEEVELTVYGDHLFYDDLQSEEGGAALPGLRGRRRRCRWRGDAGRTRRCAALHHSGREGRLRYRSAWQRQYAGTIRPHLGAYYWTLPRRGFLRLEGS